MTPKTIGLQSALSKLLSSPGGPQAQLLTELQKVGQEILSVLGIDGTISFQPHQGKQGISAAQALLTGNRSLALTLELTTLRVGATAVVTEGGVSCGLSVLNGVPLPAGTLSPVTPAPVSLLQLVDLLNKTASARAKSKT